MLDLDADPVAIDEHLGRDPHLAPLVRRAAGRRVPGVADPAEFAVQAVLSQQVSTAAARTHAARLVIAHGEPIDDPGAFPGTDLGVVKAARARSACRRRRRR